MKNNGDWTLNVLAMVGLLFAGYCLLVILVESFRKGKSK